MAGLHFHVLGWTEFVEASRYDVAPTYAQSFDQFVSEDRRQCRLDIRRLPISASNGPLFFRFDASATAFVLEAENGPRVWRFEIADHLPRPNWGGSQEPRIFLDHENLADSFLLTHDCYLDV